MAIEVDKILELDEIRGMTSLPVFKVVTPNTPNPLVSVGDSIDEFFEFTRIVEPDAIFVEYYYTLVPITEDKIKTSMMIYVEYGTGRYGLKLSLPQERKEEIQKTIVKSKLIKKH